MKSAFLIELIIYMCFGIGSVLLMWTEIEILIGRYKLRHRLKALKIQEKQLPGLLKYLFDLINISFEKESKKRLFLITELLLYLISYFLSYRNFTAVTALGISFITISIPFIFLAVKLEASRTKASKEGISFVSELYRQYRINNLNIYEAMEKTAITDGDYKLSSKCMTSLLIRLRSACGPIEIRESINMFVFSFGTVWAKMLGQCIRLSIENGTDVSSGLADIAMQLKEAYSIEEKRRMLNGEASRMTLLLIPLMYICCMLVALLYLDISPVSLLQNQFLNPTGYLLFLLIIFLFLFNYLLIFMLRNTKLDY